MRKEVKAIVVDLDHTTLHSDLTVSEETLSVFERCRAAGKRLVIASARPYRCVEQYAEQIKPDAVVFHNGAAVLLQDKLIYERYLSAEDTRQILEDILRTNSRAEVSVEMAEGYYANFDVSTVWPDQSAILVEDNNFPYLPSYKILLNVTKKEETDELAARLPESAYAELSEGRLALIMRKEATKMRGVKKALSSFSISPREAVAFGDDYGDIPLLKGCGIGVAVGNALPEVKEAANDITGTNDEDGVASWLSFWLLRETLFKEYGIWFKKEDLIRDFIGRVSKLTGSQGTYILKLFREGKEMIAEKSAIIMKLLKNWEYKVPDIKLTLSGQVYFTFEGRAGVLMEYIKGEEPEKEKLLPELGRLSADLQRLLGMRTLMLPVHRKDYLVDRYIKIIKEVEGDVEDKSLSAGFEKIGRRLYAYANTLSRRECHGDFHTGNMLLKRKTPYLFDFDAVACTCCMMDAAAMCDETDYFSLADENFTEGLRKTQESIKAFMSGYTETFRVSRRDLKGVLACIGLRHFDIQATIIEATSKENVTREFLASQLLWLQKWCRVCGFSLDDRKPARRRKRQEVEDQPETEESDSE